jgi:hypothetical protein
MALHARCRAHLVVFALAFSAGTSSVIASFSDFAGVWPQPQTQVAHLALSASAADRARFEMAYCDLDWQFAAASVVCSMTIRYY